MSTIPLRKIREGAIVQDRIEPQILMSRLMTFVFATAIVVLGVMGITLVKMFPLNRPQVFFLTTQPRAELDVRLYPLKPDEKNPNIVDAYMRSFVKEYITLRNEITPNAKVMHRKWTNQDGGAINTWSTPEVYAEFADTAMWNLVMRDEFIHDVRCNVEFANPAVTPKQKHESYTVNFSYFCTNNNGQTDRKDYTIVVTLEKEPDNATTKWADRMANPLGIRVSGYEVIAGGGDPLNFD